MSRHAVDDDPRQRVLVLCTGNSCRSIMAEALINARRGDRYRAWSAGSQPTGEVHPRALATLRRHGIDPGSPRSESWDHYADQPFDYVVTVCDAAAGEACPLFPGAPQRLHWSTPDPARATGTDADRDAAFEQAFQQLCARVAHELP
ncbi:MAG: arsenate reductase ArsC [Pseudomonadales bacterium]|nr:arsenate reductase ArsC [Pseudomonadales bacterium]